MKMEFCRGCGNEIHETALSCPQCGFASAISQSGEKVNNTLVWILAFAPLLGVFLAGVLAGATGRSINSFWWTTLVLNVGISMADERMLKKAGHPTDRMGGAWLVPVYLYKRAKVLGQGNACFIVWIVLFVLSLFSDQ